MEVSIMFIFSVKHRDNANYFRIINKITHTIKKYITICYPVYFPFVICEAKIFASLFIYIKIFISRIKNITFVK